MYRLVKWAYDLGKKHALSQLEAELYLFIGREPTKINNPEFDMVESDKSFQKRVDGWFEAQKILGAFFADKRPPERDDEL